MANHVLLNNIDHQDVRIITRRSAEFGDNQMACMTFPDELRLIQAHYPIFFQKDTQSGDFMPVALFGFEKGENLYLSDNGWDADYIPALIERQPFTIGMQASHDGGEPQRVIHLDLDDPRVSKTEGEPLFLEFGGKTPYLDRVSVLLEAIHHGIADNKGWMDALLKAELLESMSLDITLKNGATHQLLGFYTINEDRLADLDGNTVAELHRQGYLAHIYMVLASQAKLQDLIRRKNNQLDK